MGGVRADDTRVSLLRAEVDNHCCEREPLPTLAPCPAAMPCDDYWIQRWAALVRRLLRWRAPTRRGQGKRKAAQRTRRQLLEAVAELLEGAEGVGEEEEY